MKRLLWVFIIGMIYVYCHEYSAWGGFSQRMVWESQMIQSTSNGGGFCSTYTAVGGVDYSTRTTPMYNFTGTNDLWITANNKIIRSSLTPFTSDMLGNVISITGGTNWTVGKYEITAVVNSSATLDRACGTQSSIKGLARLGGCLGERVQVALVMGSLTAGNTFWIMKGTYTVDASMSASNNGILARPVSIIGYKTTRGDNPTTIADMPRLAVTGSNNFTTGTYWSIKYSSFSIGTSGSGVTLGDGSIIDTCRIGSAGLLNSMALGLNGGAMAVNCNLENGQGFGVKIANQGKIIGSYIHDCSTGIHLSGGNAVVSDNLITNNKSMAIQYHRKHIIWYSHFNRNTRHSVRS
jgi:hypothetical protein